MKDEQTSFLKLPIHPAIGGESEAEWLLGIGPDWIKELCVQKHLKQLGGYSPGCGKYFSISYLLQLRNDQEWMDKAVRIMRKHYQDKNSRNKGRQ